MKRLKSWAKKEWFLLILLFIFLPLFFLSTQNPIKYIDFKTIKILTLLLLITTAIKESGFFEYAADKIISKIHNKRVLGFWLVGANFLLSMFLTNDITLFITIPLTVTLSRFLNYDLSKIIILEALAVNAGSALTPIGNPQNIFIYSHYNLEFLHFIKISAPLAVLMFMVLTAFVFTLKNTSFTYTPKKRYVNKKMFFISFGIFIVSLLAMESGFINQALVVAAIIYLCFYKEVIKKFDFMLIVTFVFIFMDIGMISKFINFGELSAFKTFNYSIVLSQFISNVPSAILLANYTTHYKELIWGVNLAGNGTVTASLANLIALRLSNTKFGLFHKYSFTFFALTYLLALFIV
ncbi:MAG: citrate transporter [Epsilonproteobacteria bacterium]|nr:citrate transporter [Campylobacterota bacterium]